MLPIRDTIRSNNFPIMNWILIGLNTLVFLFEVSLAPSGLNRLIQNFGIVPARFDFSNLGLLLNEPRVLLTLLTHMFLHGGWFHFLSNIWVLHIFGDNVEDRMGAGRFLLFYLLSGLVAAFSQILFSPGSSVPAIGASGAIAGVLGAYFLMYPGARVTTLILIFIFPWFVELPAVIFLGFWFVSQLFYGIASLGLPAAASMGGVAWFAHIGGFVFGMLFYKLFISRSPFSYPHQYPDQYRPW
jgi:membrane associated rhomboid family serine protease